MTRHDGILKFKGDTEMTSTQTATRAGLPLTGPTLLNALAENWWLLLLRGAAAIAFALAFRLKKYKQPD
jgi:hypothetical protein